MKKFEPCSDAFSDVTCFVMAGGQGKRLRPLTSHTPKPLLGFGAVHCLLDFTLSNVIHSGLGHAYVLSQYRSAAVGKHLEGYQHEYPDLTIVNQPPVSGKRYRGTADAVRQNLAEIRTDFILVLSADHVYRMDYRPLLEYAAARGFGVTVACIPVPREQARHFGIATTAADGRITDFEEKPAHAPRGISPMMLASMGVYVFTRTVIEEAVGELSTRYPDLDFGHHLLPFLVGRGTAGAYDVRSEQQVDYWRDVGTLAAYHHAHMEFLDRQLGFDTLDPCWPVHAIEGTGPSREEPGARADSVVAASAFVGRCRLEKSVVGAGAVVEDGADVRESVLLPGARVGRGSVVRRAILNADACVAGNDEIGLDRASDNARFEVTKTGVTVVATSRPPSPVLTRPEPAVAVAH